MMADQFFVYDTSITAPLSRVPMWPYTLYYRFLAMCTLSKEFSWISSRRELWVQPD
jgi:hypothetical protein